jgi:oxygen-independent coproporphyrinogen-3 oxidase
MTGEGVSYSKFKDVFGENVRDRWAEEIDRFTRYGLLEVTEDRIRLTERGIFMANDVMAAFL